MHDVRVYDILITFNTLRNDISKTLEKLFDSSIAISVLPTAAYGMLEIVRLYSPFLEVK